MNKEFKRMLELAGLTEIKINRPLNFYFAVIEDGLEYREIGDNNTYLASFELDDLDAEENPWITFNISIDASYDDVDFLEDDVEEFILNASDIDPNFNIKFFKSFINNLNKVKIPFDFYFEKDGGYVYPSVEFQYNDIKKYIKR
jgi:hypothetical protein